MQILGWLAVFVLFLVVLAVLALGETKLLYKLKNPKVIKLMYIGCTVLSVLVFMGIVYEANKLFGI